mgnify:CR=1 FL=1|tara:strand:+ start:74 stop:292 length:219 start_codon:yes stop_codon:yes gene_type:complete
MPRLTIDERAAKLKGWKVIEMGLHWYVYQGQRHKVGGFCSEQDAEVAMAKAKVRHVRYMNEVARIKKEEARG